MQQIWKLAMHLTLAGLLAVGLTACGGGDGGNGDGGGGNGGDGNPPFVSTGAANQARSVVSTDVATSFTGVARDAGGNVYAVATLNTTGGTVSFGTNASGKEVAINPPAGVNSVLVKYDAAGKPQWARMASGGNLEYAGVATDADGNVYAVGMGHGADPVSYGKDESGVDVTTTGGPGNNAALVKYDAAGTVQWALTQAAGDECWFDAVAVDANANVYAAGVLRGTAVYDFGNGVTVSGPTDFNYHSLLVKFNTAGKAQWARSVEAAPATSGASFSGVAVDASGNAYAVGTILEDGTYSFGKGVSVAGSSATPRGNAVIVKYRADGTAQWARSNTAGADGAEFNGVAVDGSGNAYAVGYVSGTSTYQFGTNVTVTPTNPDDAGDDYALLVKYDASGVAQWANTTSVTVDDIFSTYSHFRAVAVDDQGNAYVAGEIADHATYHFGDGVDLTGAAKGETSVALVKYDATGKAQWAKTNTADVPSSATFRAVTVDGEGRSVAAGDFIGPATLTFGDAVTVEASTPGSDAFLVAYE